MSNLFFIDYQSNKLYSVYKLIFLENKIVNHNTYIRNIIII